MKRRSQKKADIMSLAMTGAGVAGGMLIGKVVTKKVAVLNNNPLLGAGAQFVLAYVAKTSKLGGTMSTDLAAGFAANGLVSILTTLLPDISTKLGIAGLGGISGVGYLPQDSFAGSYTMPGVAGNGVKVPYIMNVQ